MAWGPFGGVGSGYSTIVAACAIGPWNTIRAAQSATNASRTLVILVREARMLGRPEDLPRRLGSLAHPNGREGRLGEVEGVHVVVRLRVPRPERGEAEDVFD